VADELILDGIVADTKLTVVGAVEQLIGRLVEAIELVLGLQTTFEAILVMLTPIGIVVLVFVSITAFIPWSNFFPPGRYGFLQPLQRQSTQLLAST
jgi:hypothetical protein